MSLSDSYREFKLNNGLFVALQNTPTKTINANFSIWYGALNENTEEHGIAHFLEHSLLMGGSKKYNPKKSDKIRGMFGQFNAYTELNRTFFEFDMLNEDMELYLNYISDFIMNPRLDKKRVNEERKIVLREYNDEKSNPLFEYKKNHLETFFGKNSPHTYDILGNNKIIDSATVNDLRKFHKRGYNANNIDIILVGNLPKNIEKLINKNFGSLDCGINNKIILPRNRKLTKPSFIHSYAPELLNNENPNKSSAQLNFSFFSPTKTDSDSYDVSMLVDILGGDSNSRLFQNVRQRQGLAYSINAGYRGSDNCGIIGISSNVQAINYNKIIDSIFLEMKKLQNDLISYEDLNRLKKKSKYYMLKSFETNRGILRAIELKKEYKLTPEIYLEGINSVTPEKIMEAARKYLPSSRINGKYVLSLRDPLKK